MTRLTLTFAFLLAASTAFAQNYTNDEVFNLNSNPNSTHIIYLDFTGYVTTRTNWNKETDINRPTITTPVFSIDGNTAYSQTELNMIREIWARVSEDYAPFNVNVTTVAPTSDQLIKSGPHDDVYGVRVAIGGSSQDVLGNGSYGGIAYMDQYEQSVFGMANLSPAFVFPANLSNNTKNIAEAVSHEVGHNLGLKHDGRTPNEDYYYGNGVWAPIMGAGYSASVTQWSNSSYPNANNNQDELAIIARGLGYRADDYGNYIDRTATMLTDFVTGSIADPYLAEFYLTGIIEQNTDVDVFQFTIGEGGGEFSFEVISGIWSQAGTNLDVLAQLFYGSEENLLYRWDPQDTMGIDWKTVSLVDAGTYYFSLEGTGREGYYPKYGSLGTYAFRGSILGLASSVPEPATLAIFGLGLAGLGLVCRRTRK